MLIPELDIEKIFTKLTKHCRSGALQVAIFSAYDIDSLCASQILIVPLSFSIFSNPKIFNTNFPPFLTTTTSPSSARPSPPT